MEEAHGVVILLLGARFSIMLARAVLLASRKTRTDGFILDDCFSTV